MYSTTEITMLALQSGAAPEAVDAAMKPMDLTKQESVDGQKMDDLAKLKYLAKGGNCFRIAPCKNCPLHPCRADSKGHIRFLAKMRMAEMAGEGWNG